MDTITERTAQLLRRELEHAVGDDARLLGCYVQLRYRTRRATATLSWTGGPLADHVAQVVADLTADLQRGTTHGDQTPLQLVYQRTPLWSCGSVHDGPGAAFLAHEGADLLVAVTVDGCCAHCTDVDHFVDPAALATFLDDGGDTTSACTPQPTSAACPDCAGRGSRVDARLHPGPCGTCGGRGLFDLADPAQLAPLRDLYATRIRGSRRDRATTRRLP